MTRSTLALPAASDPAAVETFVAELARALEGQGDAHCSDCHRPVADDAAWAAHEADEPIEHDGENVCWEPDACGFAFPGLSAERRQAERVARALGIPVTAMMVHPADDKEIR